MALEPEATAHQGFGLLAGGWSHRAKLEAGRGGKVPAPWSHSVRVGERRRRLRPVAVNHDPFLRLKRHDLLMKCDQPA
jgi:hypothetical protein